LKRLSMVPVGVTSKNLLMGAFIKESRALLWTIFRALVTMNCTKYYLMQFTRVSPNTLTNILKR
jgi:hypothetical protein